MIKTYAQVIGQPQHPIYALNSFGLRVNIRRGAILAEPRTIFIKNLSYRCSENELNVLLKDNVGHFVLANPLNDSRGDCNGAATVEFLSPKDAQRAISVLEGFTHMGRKLYARLAKEETHIGQTGPLVVASPIYKNV
jgi:RNA recognition motif-containing protein